MKDALTTAWAWVVAALIYGLFVVTAVSYFGKIILWICDMMNG